MKNKLIIIYIFLAFILSGCKASTIEPHKERNNVYNDTYHLLYFYYDTCSKCQSFSTQVIPIIEEEFGEHIIITKYNLDSYDTLPIYNTTIDKLVDFDSDEDYGSVPLIVFEDYFGLLGYNAGDQEYILDDLISAINNEPLSERLSNLRYEYIKK